MVQWVHAWFLTVQMLNYFLLDLESTIISIYSLRISSILWFSLFGNHMFCLFVYWFSESIEYLDFVLTLIKQFDLNLIKLNRPVMATNFIFATNLIVLDYIYWKSYEMIWTVNQNALYTEPFLYQKRWLTALRYAYFQFLLSTVQNLGRNSSI